jgi:tRNA nucleotidyltransferase/poly(A) polymerase
VGISLEQDMERRDFTINAIARRLETGEVLDPLGGRADLELGVLRTTSPTSFRDDPLRIVRGLRFVSQLGFDPDEDTLRQMREWAPQLEHVSGERVGGGLTADGLGELSKLLLGPHPAKALRLARDAGVLLHLLPEFEPAIGYRQRSDRQHLTLDEHVFAVVQAAADAGVSLEVRLAALLHDLGKPQAEREGGDHAEIGAGFAARALSRLRYPTRLRAYVVRLVREHPFAPEGEPTAVDARRFLARHGERLALDLLAHRAADLAGKTVPESEWDWLGRFRVLVEQERGQPHRLADLDVDGGDLIAAGFSEGPQLGRVLQTLLDEVVEDPERNDREQLLTRARELA